MVRARAFDVVSMPAKMNVLHESNKQRSLTTERKIPYAICPRSSSSGSLSASFAFMFACTRDPIRPVSAKSSVVTYSACS